MKTIIVTGASRGIGAAICRSLRVKGVRVIGVARSTDSLASLSMEKIGSAPLEYVAGDVGNAGVVQKAVDLATSNGHSLDALILNAGAIGPVGKLLEVGEEEVKRSLEVNLFSSVGWIRAAIPHLRASGGRVIYTSSGVATTPYAGFAAYCTGKAAMNMYIGVLAQEEPSVTFLAVAPGIVQTEMSESFFERGRPYMAAAQVAYIEGLRKEGKMLQPESVADAYAKLALSAPRARSGQFVTWNDRWVADLAARAVTG